MYGKSLWCLSKAEIISSLYLHLKKSSGKNKVYFPQISADEGADKFADLVKKFSNCHLSIPINVLLRLWNQIFSKQLSQYDLCLFFQIKNHKSASYLRIFLRRSAGKNKVYFPQISADEGADLVEVISNFFLKNIFLSYS